MNPNQPPYPDPNQSPFQDHNQPPQQPPYQENPFNDGHAQRPPMPHPPSSGTVNTLVDPPGGHPLADAGPSNTASYHEAAGDMSYRSYGTGYEDDERLPLTSNAIEPEYHRTDSIYSNYPPSTVSTLGGGYGGTPPPQSGYGTDFSAPAPIFGANAPGYGGGYGGGPSVGFSDAINFPVPNPNSRVRRDQEFLQRQKTRRGQLRKTELSKAGHWVQEYQVPAEVSSVVDERWKAMGGKNEFTHMRYTACTCDPDDFTKENGWTLRHKEFRDKEYGRSETDLLIAVTSYNEDKNLYSRTLDSVMENIRDICNGGRDPYWTNMRQDGREPWKRITLALIADGLEPMDTSVLDLLAAVGVFQDGVMKKAVGDDTTVAHIFEYTTQLSITSKMNLVKPNPADPKKSLVPVQIIFVLKQANAKKINSHRWLFNAIGKQLKPEVCVLLDAGTKPGKEAIFYLWEAFHYNRNLGGACGEIHAMIKKGKKLINPLVAAQNFEYKMSNILDKPFESAFGYVAVLPGAFSAYRFEALQGKPLQQYFHGDGSMQARLAAQGHKQKEMRIFEKNMFLAEDRILCFELVAKKNAAYTLSYVKRSKAETDVPEECAELISQRRRWLNGSFAAGVYSLFKFFDIWGSGHNPIRKLFLTIQAIYNVVNLIFSWFALANMWLTFSLIIQLLPNVSHDKFFSNINITHWLNLALQWVYLIFLALQFILALGSRPKGAKILYNASFVAFGVLSAWLILCSVWLSVLAFQGALGGDGTAIEKVKTLFNSTNGVLVAAVASTVGIYFIASALALDISHMFLSFPQYMLIAPSFTNILNVYAFCNLHDVSWGTKGSDKADALPSVKMSKKGAIMDDSQVDEKELAKSYKATLERALTKLDVVKEVEKPNPDDQNRTFRTNFVLSWLLSNAALVLVIGFTLGIDETKKMLAKCLPNGYDPTSDKEVKVTPLCIANAIGYQDETARKRQTVYFQILLWGTFGLTAFRFIGFLWFLLGHWFFRLPRLFRRRK